MDSKLNLLGIIGLIGAIIMIVGVFLAWLTAEGLLGAYTYTGMDIMNNVDNIATGITIGGVKYALGYSFLPILALICGIIALLLMIVPTFVNTDKFEKINNILGIIVLILAIIVIIVAVLFYTQSWPLLGGSIALTDYYNIGIGFWLVLVGAIITFIGGIMPIAKNKFLS